MKPQTATDSTTISLPSGSKLAVRPVEPTDKPLLQAGFTKLTDETRYRRFFASKVGLTHADVRHMTEVDHRDSEVILALDGSTLAGTASYDRDPDRRHVAEVALVIADDWQRQGVGTALVRELARRARSHGIRRFEAEVLASNDPALNLLRSIHVTPASRQHGGVIRVEGSLSRLNRARLHTSANRLRTPLRRWRAARRATRRQQKEP